MNTIRIKFQKYLSNTEYKLKNYKNSYPRNFGDLLRNGFPILMMWLGVLLGIHGFKGGSGNEDWIGEFLISGVLFLFGLIVTLKTRKYYIKVDPPKECIESIKNEFEQYPDVKKYVDETETELNAEIKHKRKIKVIYNIGFIGSFILLTVYVLVDLGLTISYEVGKEYNNTMSHDGMTKALNLDAKTPFLSLQPVTTTIDNNIKIADKKLDIYLSDFYSNDMGSVRILRTQKPEITGCNNGEMFRITITESDGRPVTRCPRFSFSTESSDNISTYMFCYVPDVEKQSTFQTLQTLRYLQKNKDNLRFLVEKIN
ncbi:MAG: hypothetical protein IKQ46_18535 [Bacteroidales bacterium]|nr:hypothetical protein [Bacteroidales bacterium]